MLYQQIKTNKRKSRTVICFYFLFFLLVGSCTGKFWFDSPILGVFTAAVVGGGYIISTIVNASKIVLKMNRAGTIKQNEYPEVYNILSDLCLVARLPMPKLYVIQDESPNAFATGITPDKAVIVVTSGLLITMTREELEGVLAHELSHIKNYDIQLQTIVLALNALIIMAAQTGRNSYLWKSSDSNDSSSTLGQILTFGSLLIILVSPVIASAIQCALSRKREYLADASAVELTRNPQGLVQALEKISLAKPMKKVNKFCIFLYFSDPINKSKHRKTRQSIFDSHPPLKLRIERLRDL
ncbi:M48 family metalloprotease [Enterococcus faecalis]|uniref:M48 family metalloprotease n=1 Tax=Enterococcus TaxID=1350 RepID=UPI001A95EC5F|nr:M48 family metalloprotease [Enterococcus faecalis]MBO1125368.1 M48 family metalloprotease [Enterococcus faecalis]